MTITDTSSLHTTADHLVDRITALAAQRDHAAAQAAEALEAGCRLQQERDRALERARIADARTEAVEAELRLAREQLRGMKNRIENMIAAERENAAVLARQTDEITRLIAKNRRSQWPWRTGGQL